MKSFIVVKRKGKCHVRNYNRPISTGIGFKLALFLCFVRNRTLINIACLFLIFVMPFIGCGDKSGTDGELLVVEAIESDIKLDKDMIAVSKYIQKKTRKCKTVSDYIAYSIVKESKNNNVPIDLTVGIIEVESDFDPFAVGPAVGNKKKTAKGLMQILDKGVDYNNKTKKYRLVFDQSKIFDVNYNIKCGIEVFKSKIYSNKTKRKPNKKYKRTVFDQALYDYVGGDSEYVEKVREKRHEFSVFYIYGG